MLYSVAKWLFILSSKSLARRFRTYVSSTKNRKFSRRAHELDGLLMKMMGFVKEAAENHALNVKVQDGVESEYMKKLKENVRVHVKTYSGYEERQNDAKPFDNEILVDLLRHTEEDLINPSDFIEAQEKVNELMSEERNGDNRSE